MFAPPQHHWFASIACLIGCFILTSCGFSTDTDDIDFSSYSPYYGTYQPYISPSGSPNYYDPFHSMTVQAEPEVVSPSPTPAPTPTPVPTAGSTHDVRGHRPGPKNFSTVIIDAGHGGKDSGARHGGAMEKTLALDIAKRLQQQLAGSFKTVMIRQGDYFVGLNDRVRKANRYRNAILVSIHLNHSRSTSARGPESYYFRVDSYGLAKRLQRSVRAVSPLTRSQGLVRRRLRLTRNPEIPCVLIELGYLSNPADRRLLLQPAYRQKLAIAMASAIKTQNRIGDTGMGSLPPPLNRPLSRPTDTTRL